MRYKSLTCAIAMSVGMLTAPLALADLNDGLIAHYPFDGNAQDASGNGNDAGNPPIENDSTNPPLGNDAGEPPINRSKGRELNKI